MKTANSNCLYCNLPIYGKGCRFAPNGLHVHATINKCMYCGLNAIGKGCRFAPNGLHVKFNDFGFIQKENISRGMLAGYLLKELEKPITCHEAYKQGIVDEHGTLKRKPDSESDRRVFNLLEQTLINLKKYLNKNTKTVINETLFCNCLKQNKAFDVHEYEKELELKLTIEQIANQLYNTIEQYKEYMSTEKIDQCIMEGFIKANESQS